MLEINEYAHYESFVMNYFRHEGCYPTEYLCRAGLMAPYRCSQYNMQLRIYRQLGKPI